MDRCTRHGHSRKLVCRNAMILTATALFSSILAPTVNAAPEPHHDRVVRASERRAMVTRSRMVRRSLHTRAFRRTYRRPIPIPFAVDAPPTAGMSAFDCNDNGILDGVEIPRVVVGSAGPTGPFGAGVAPEFILESPPRAAGPVQFIVSAQGDIGQTSEFLTIRLNGVNVGTV
ncbi:MAG: hypothetical protein AAF432_12275, partial [Planctomycetota bacterium]